MLFSDPSRTDPGSIVAWHKVCESGIDRELLEAKHAVIHARPLGTSAAEVITPHSTLNQIDAYFASSKREIEIAAILTLIASMEARIRLDAAFRSNNSSANGFLGGRLKILLAKSQRTWQVPLYERGILDEWKLAGNALGTPGLAMTIGSFSDLLKIRHWTAHGRYWLLKTNLEVTTSIQASNTILNLEKQMNQFCAASGWAPFPSR
jgi:hypothetical protein